MPITDPLKRGQAAPVFQVEKKNSEKSKLVQKLEFVLILLVLVGTLVWFLFRNHFSFSNFFKGFTNHLKPVVASDSSARKTSSPEENLKNSFERDKIGQIASLAETTEGDFDLKTTEGLEILFSKDKNFDEQTRTLQTILAKAKIDNKSLKKVDFRFEKIVVQY